MENIEPSQNKISREAANLQKPEYLHSLNQAIIITDLIGKIIFWNKSAKDIYGWTEKEALGKNIIDIVPTQQTREQALEIMNLLRQGQSWSGTFVAQRRNGDLFSAFVTDLPYYDAQQQLAGIIGISADVTQEKKLEREIRLLLNNSEESFILLDAALNIISFNRVAFSLYKKFLGKELARGVSILQYASSERTEQLKEVYQKVLNGESPQSELTFNDEHDNKYIYALKYSAAKDEADRIMGVFISARDVTSQKKAEATLIANEARWHALIENIHDIFIIINLQGNIEYLSPSIGTTLGYESNDLLNKRFYDLFDDGDQAIMREKIESALTHPGVKQQQDRIRIKHKSGKWIWVESSFTNLLENDTIQSMIYTARDITRLVESFAILEEEKQNKEALINATNDLVWSINDKYEWVTANEAFIQNFKQLSGVDLKFGETLQQTDKFDKDWLKLWESIYSRAFSGESIRQEIFIPKNAGNKKNSWTEVSCNPIWRDNKVVAIACLARDITERKSHEEKEKELAVSRSLFSAMINNSEDAIVSKTLESVITSWNKGAEKIFGYTSKEVLGKSITLIIPPELIQEETYILNKIKDKHPVENFETERLDKLGNRKTVSITVSPILDIEGNVVGASKIARDISRQKKDAIAIQQNEARLQGIINSQTNYVLRTDLEGNYTYYNDKFFDDFGWYRKGESLIGVSGMETIMSYHHETVLSTVNKCMSEPNKVFQVELDKPFLNGSIKTTFWDFICLTDQDGNLTEIQCVGIDITKRVETEQLLKQSLDEKNSILESIGDAFIAVDKNWITTYWNKNAESMLGITKEKIIGKNFWEFFPEHLNPTSYDNFKKAVEKSEPVQYESYYPVTERWYEISVYPALNGLSAYFKDITEKKESADLIMEANERFNLVSRATNDVIWDWNVVTRSVQRSAENMKKVFGYDKSFKTDSIDFWMEKIHPDDIERVNKRFNIVFNNKDESFLDSEYRFKKADGSYAYVYDKGYIIRDASGTPLRLIGAVQDVSWLKENELQLQKKSEELAVSNKELEQFAFVASHDLQEPLRMVTSFLTQLKKNYEGALDERANTYIKFAVDGAARMRQIILDLLAYSRVGRITQKLENVDISVVVKEIEVLFQQKIEEVNATIIFDNLPVIHTHRSPMDQLLQNLIMNALKFSRPGIPPKIEITATEDATQWTFAVKDNGIGIEKMYFDKIFILFQRLHSREEYAGTGIGLSVAKKIVENMGGSIWVESLEGQGSTFFFSIKKV